MKVYTHYLNENGIEYRWRTILQIGDSWVVRGTVFMKNPGSSRNIKATLLSIDNEDILSHLKEFDDIKTSPSREWYEFSIDNTMACLKDLFEAYYQAQGIPLNGVIQIFNLFNIRDANLMKAMGQSEGDVIDELTYTTDYDIKNIVSPVYIGWGNLWNNPKYCEIAKKIFYAVYNKSSYLCDGIQNNKYYHPLYLMKYGKKKVNCKIELTRFVNGSKHPTEQQITEYK